jgi:cyanophycinase
MLGVPDDTNATDGPGRGGLVALISGGPFRDNDELDRRLLREVGAELVVVLPTAEAFEEPAALVAAAMSWAERLEVDIEALMVLQRHDADDPGAAEVIRGARAVYLAGDSSQHLRSALKDTPVYEALGAVVDQGGLVAAVGPCAAALCDPMLDQRGGAFTLGLGFVRGLAVIPEADAESEERRQRTLSLATTPVVELPAGAAIVRRGREWELVGAPTVHGDLP